MKQPNFVKKIQMIFDKYILRSAEYEINIKFNQRRKLIEVYNKKYIEYDMDMTQTTHTLSGNKSPLTPSSPSLSYMNNINNQPSPFRLTSIGEGDKIDKIETKTPDENTNISINIPQHNINTKSNNKKYKLNDEEYVMLNNDVNIEDININDMNIIIENCIIESPQGFGIETGVDITGKSEFFQPFSELNFSSCRKPNYSNRNIMIKNNNICYSRWSGIHIGCVAMSYILNNNIYKNKINGIWTTTYAAPMIEYNNLYDNGWEALCCNNLGGAYFKNNELNNNGLCLDFNIENNGSYSLWNNHDNEHTKVEV
eukprot:478328_1